MSEKNRKRDRERFLPGLAKESEQSLVLVSGDQIVKKLQRLAPVTRIAQELVRFDTQVLENPDIQGKEYQQGTLAGYEVREYLLEKWGRRCFAVYLLLRNSFLINLILKRGHYGSF